MPADVPNISTEKSDPLIGAKIDGRFEIVSRVGAGGMSVVYRANHLLMAKVVAIKLLQANLGEDRLSTERFKREIQTMSTLEHPHIVRTLSSGVLEDGRAYLAMEYNNGQSLSYLINSQGRLPWRRAVDIFCQVAEALEYAHQSGIVHRDVKPSNVIIDSDHNGKERAQVLDFGVLQFLDPPDAADLKLTSTNTTVPGSPPYMSPEQCRQEGTDTRSDIYAAGCSLYETLVGAPPFTGASMLEVMFKHVHEPAPLLPADVSAPNELRAVIARALQKDPADRYQSMAAFRSDLTQCLQSQTAKDSARPPSMRLATPKLPWTAWVAIAVCSIACTLSVFINNDPGIATLAPNIVPLLAPSQRQSTLIAAADCCEKAGMLDAAHSLYLQAAQFAPFPDSIEAYRLRMIAADLNSSTGVDETAEYRHIFDKLINYACKSSLPVEEDPDKEIRERFQAGDKIRTALILALELRRRLPQKSTAYDPNFGMELSALGTSLNNQNFHPDAERILSQAEPIVRSCKPQDFISAYVSIWNRLGEAYFCQIGTKPNLNTSMLEKCRAAFERGLEERKRYSEDGSFISSGMVQLAMVYYAWGKDGQADALIDRATKLTDEDVDGDNERGLALARSLEYDGFMLNASNPVAARRLFERAVAARRKFNCGNNKEEVEDLRNIGLALGAEGKYKEALCCWTQAGELLIKSGREIAGESAVIWLGNVQIRQTLGMLEEAVPYMQKTIKCAVMPGAQDIIPQCALDYCALEKGLGKTPGDVKVVEQRIRSNMSLSW